MNTEIYLCDWCSDAVCEHCSDDPDNRLCDTCFYEMPDREPDFECDCEGCKEQDDDA